MINEREYLKMNQLFDISIRNLPLQYYSNKEWLIFHLDINECTLGTHQCNVNADCTNTDGGYTCACKIGFSGDGFECAGIIFV